MTQFLFWFEIILNVLIITGYMKITLMFANSTHMTLHPSTWRLKETSATAAATKMVFIFMFCSIAGYAVKSYLLIIEHCMPSWLSVMFCTPLVVATWAYVLSGQVALLASEDSIKTLMRDIQASR